MPDIEFTYLPIETELSFIQIRSVKYWGVERLKKSMQDRGFLDGKPVEVVRVNGGYRLFEGRHRWEAAKLADIKQVPALIHDNMPDDEQYRQAFLANESNDSMVPQTFVDHAELIWHLDASGKNNTAIKSILGWKTDGQVSQYKALSRIDKQAWALIFTTFDCEPNGIEDSSVNKDFTPVKTLFTENLLRSIVDLEPDQQVNLVRQLIKDNDKAKFKSGAEYLKAENEMVKEAERQLKALPEEYLSQAITEIRKGLYGKEYKANGNKPGPAFLKLLQSLKDTHEGTQNYRCIPGDFQVVSQEIEAESIDVILTDPPYGKDWLEEFDALGELAARVLKPGGSLLVMYGQSFLYEAHALLAKHLSYHWTIAYLTPGGQSVGIWAKEVNTFWKPVLWFVKGKYTGKWEGDCIPVAQSAVNDNDKRFHQWGQSESGMASLIERFTTQGEVILDPCMGAGTTGVAALSRRRKFTGIERDLEALEQASIRLQRVAETLATIPD